MHTGRESTGDPLWERANGMTAMGVRFHSTEIEAAQKPINCSVRRACSTGLVIPMYVAVHRSVPIPRHIEYKIQALRRTSPGGRKV
jgi:hypothetical protein